MYTSLKAKLFAAALQNAQLVYLLGSGSPLVMRWYDQQLSQANTTAAGFPAVVVKQITNPQTYAVSGRLPTSFARMEFLIYGTGPDSQNADAIAQALFGFLDSFAGDGVTGRTECPNYVLGDRDHGIAQTQPMTWLRVIDTRIFWNPNV